MTPARTPLKLVPPLAAAPAAPASATERIVDAITAAIIERRLMPGTKLSEQKLGDIFQVSRTLVRQALNQLCRDRLVTLAQARGAFVATPSIEEARQVLEVRSMLAYALVRQLCTCISDRQVAELRVHLRQEAAALARTDVPGRTQRLADFHTMLARMLGNQVLAEMLNDLRSRSSLIALMYPSPHAAEHAYEQHVQIVDALEKRDARQAAKLMSAPIAKMATQWRLDPPTLDLAAALRPGGGRP